jgi:hypothetical protein
VERHLVILLRSRRAHTLCRRHEHYILYSWAGIVGKVCEPLYHTKCNTVLSCFLHLLICKHLRGPKLKSARPVKVRTCTRPDSTCGEHNTQEVHTHSGTCLSTTGLSTADFNAVDSAPATQPSTVTLVCLRHIYVLSASCKPAPQAHTPSHGRSAKSRSARAWSEWCMKRLSNRAYRPSDQVCKGVHNHHPTRRSEQGPQGLCSSRSRIAPELRTQGAAARTRRRGRVQSAVPLHEAADETDDAAPRRRAGAAFHLLSRHADTSAHRVALSATASSQPISVACTHSQDR